MAFWIAAIFALGILVRAESGQKRETAPNTKTPLLRIVDQNGRPAVNGVPSGTGQIVDVTVGPGGGFTFRPGRSEYFCGRHGAMDMVGQWPQRQQWSPLHSRFAILFA